MYGYWCCCRSESVEHPHLTNTVHAQSPQLFLPRINIFVSDHFFFFFKILSTQIESSLVMGSLRTKCASSRTLSLVHWQLTATTHCMSTVRLHFGKGNEVNKKGRSTLRPDTGNVIIHVFLAVLMNPTHPQVMTHFNILSPKFDTHIVRFSLLGARPCRHKFEVHPWIQRCSTSQEKIQFLSKQVIVSSLGKRSTPIFEPGGKESVLLNFDVKELHRASRIPQKLPQVLKKVDSFVETFIHPGKKDCRSAEEALMQLTSHGYRQIPLELVDENEALEASETTRSRRPQ